ncbi:bifunctional phosphopantothenoylcysteine decarboxylase/phosphopantothenate--cysteine ligase CoaBC [Sulfuriflexus sp.]|uniref:bifunctional phosphopantothenoylcysteine decarboxylase/phosphopantothenate--cysteine ligase CoaBC n=1 Tax=Sulfuriflexus sp. TaxID=2015443 RepID=UPI0028CF5CE9|nr:bifunctional phosphopantothenoylcysteine decarboxylase/phosphopantothenate--cysteine ligase CoaBC [Sulfuriflexus sp.]MDT8404632.1 bifunctional phosphopantothenoylcysteine decarboxylase/phosphopantothenate--cysteine ligase CoaBC [Sulfuriflexus sp.]
MSSLTNKRIILGVTGSIAAYKSADLIRRLREAGAEVRVIMTAGGQEFITPLTLQAVSGQPLYSELLDAGAEAGMGHITLAKWADLVLIAPASANCLARLVQGRGDDLLSAVCLASSAPLAVAPAMNQAMWANPATQDNIEILRHRGVHIFGPGEGEQACGDVGAGRMLEPAELVEASMALFATGSLAGLRVLITAGPTREPIDPMRYISNRSSGRMGYALAEACVEAGAVVTLISGPVCLPTPERVTRIDIETAAEMLAAVEGGLQQCDIFISAAAVADYRPACPAEQKLKKSDAGLSLELARTRDILARVAAHETAPFTVGFAAETENVAENARGKLQAKGLDMIAANKIGKTADGEPLGVESEDNVLQVFWQGGEQDLPRAHKSQLARQLVALIGQRYYEK